MTIAIRRVEMFLSEFIIIYLATAAPFGVARFAGDRERGSRASRAFLKSVAASLAWPATMLLSLNRLASSRAGGATTNDEGHAPDEQSVERIRRAAVNALRVVEDSIVSARGRGCEAERRALFAARESVERYAGLALACASAREDAVPAPRELELCRIAGRAGDDLLVAGRCVHRRNVTRLFAHRERARTELVHALADAREAAHNANPTPRQTYSSERACGEDAKKISEALLLALSRAVELLSLFDEREAVVAVARLLDAECSHLRRISARPADAAHHGTGKGEQS